MMERQREAESREAMARLRSEAWPQGHPQAAQSQPMPTLFEQERVVADVMMAAASTPSFSGEGNWTEAGPNAHGSTVARSVLFPPGLAREGDARGSTVSCFPPKACGHINPESTVADAGTPVFAPSYARRSGAGGPTTD